MPFALKMEEEESCQQNDRECRPIKSLLRFVGGKSRLTAQIVERIPPHLAYVEPFAGGAWVFFQKQPSQVEVLNDLDGELANFWCGIQNSES
jgi:DNA adenine methylase